MKSILDLSCKEWEERSDNNLIYSYSRLARLWREGPKSLISEEKADSDSLRFGSLVDCLLTCPEELKDKFVISDYEKPSFAVIKILDLIWDKCDKSTCELKDIDAALALKIMDQENYRTNWGIEARLRELIKAGSGYFSLLFLSKNKTLVSQSEFDAAESCVRTLKDSPFTSKYFKENPFQTDVDHFYQVPFPLLECLCLIMAGNISQSPISSHTFQLAVLTPESSKALFMRILLPEILHPSGVFISIISSIGILGNIASVGVILPNLRTAL